MKYGAVVLLLLASCAVPPTELRLWEYEDEVFQKTASGSLRVSYDFSHGSGFGVKYDGEHSWVVTCWHVTRRGPNPVVEYFEGHKTTMFIGTVVHESEDLDLSVVRITGRVPVFTLMSEKEYFAIEIGERVVGGGFPAELEPGIATIGFVTSLWQGIQLDAETMIYGMAHSAGIWPGSSGGPAVHHKSGKVAGVNARYYMASNKGWAVPSPVVLEFLETYTGW